MKENRFLEYVLQDVNLFWGKLSFMKFLQCYYLHPSFRVLIGYRLLQWLGGQILV